MVDVPQTLPSLLAFCGVIRWADLVSRAVLLGYAPRGASLTLTTQSRSDKPHRVPPVRQVQLTTGAVHNVDGGVMAGRVQRLQLS
jgi:hypothetical protein